MKFIAAFSKNGYELLRPESVFRCGQKESGFRLEIKKNGAEAAEKNQLFFYCRNGEKFLRDFIELIKISEKVHEI